MTAVFRRLHLDKYTEGVTFQSHYLEPIEFQLPRFQKETYIEPDKMRNSFRSFQFSFKNIQRVVKRAILSAYILFAIYLV